MAAVATQTRPTVFLTAAATDGPLIERVASVLDASGIEVIGRRAVPAGGTGGAYLRDFIRRSSAVVVVMSRVTTASTIPSSIIFEIGAATGAHKPVYIILEDSSVRLGFSVPDMHVLPLSRTDEVARAVFAASC